MPYKSLEQQKEANRIANRRYRDKQKGITEQGITPEGITEEMFEGKPRYITLSDGQVFDRTYRPEPNKYLPGMAACNRANKSIIRQEPGILNALVDPIKRKKLEKITQSLKAHKVDSLVYYGFPKLGGVPFDVVGDLLEATA